MRYLFALLLLAGCAGAPRGPVGPGPRFDPLAFFSGQTRGEGTLKVALQPARLTHVVGDGQREGDTLTLEQRVEEEGKPVRFRTWTLRQVAPGHYRGTLSDATGAVRGESEGNRLNLSYAMHGGMKAQQWLTLAPDGRSAQNRMVVRRFGVTVATVDETIRRVAA